MKEYNYKSLVTILNMALFFPIFIIRPSYMLNECVRNSHIPFVDCLIILPS